MLSGAFRQCVSFSRVVLKPQQFRPLLVGGVSHVSRVQLSTASVGPSATPSMPPPFPHRDEKSQQAWRLSRRIVECGMDYERLLTLIDEQVEALAPINMAIAVQRLAQAALTVEGRVRVCSSTPYVRLVERLHTQDALAQLTPQHLAATVTSLRRLGTQVDYVAVANTPPTH